MSTGSDLVTMINNINYNNNNNNTKFVSKENNQVVEDIATLPAGGEEIRALKVALVPQGTLPPKWRGLKIDLFENPRLKLKFSIIRQDNTKFECVAGMNSPRSYVFRGRVEGKGTEEYWNAVEQLFEKRKDEQNFRISKISKPRKGQTLNGLAVALYQQKHWMIDLVYYDTIYTFALKGKTSDSFSKANGIATGYYGITTTRPWADLEELGL